MNIFTVPRQRYIVVFLSFDKCTYCNLLRIKATDKCPNLNVMAMLCTLDTTLFPLDIWTATFGRLNKIPLQPTEEAMLLWTQPKSNATYQMKSGNIMFPTIWNQRCPFWKPNFENVLWGSCIISFWDQNKVVVICVQHGIRVHNGGTPYYEWHNNTKGSMFRLHCSVIIWIKIVTFMFLSVITFKYSSLSDAYQ